MMTFIALSVLACTTYPDQDAAVSDVDAQVEAGLQLPTITSPVVFADNGNLLLFPLLADDGAASATLELRAAGISSEVGFTEGHYPFWAYTSPETGEVLAYQTQLPYPLEIRGNAAEEDAIINDWSTEEDDVGELDDGWYNLPEFGANILTWYDCGVPHPNLFGGWNVDGTVNTNVQGASIGEDACADYQ